MSLPYATRSCVWTRLSLGYVLAERRWGLMQATVELGTVLTCSVMN